VLLQLSCPELQIYERFNELTPSRLGMETKRPTSTRMQKLKRRNAGKIMAAEVAALRVQIAQAFVWCVSAHRQRRLHMPERSDMRVEGAV